ncbi:MAG: hypothetical protein INQ03_22765 [Candidatus Heimdallarchaeota archaeon]|nr:hypothetical protein [Candidatus Heimdallarchaeota archaeon]
MPEYEFNNEENAIFKSATDWMSRAAGVAFFNGIILLLISALGEDIPRTIYAVSFCFQALVFYVPMDNLFNIVKTEGQDIKELIKAMKELRIGWSVYVLLQLIGLIALIISY